MLVTKQAVNQVLSLRAGPDGSSKVSGQRGHTVLAAHARLLISLVERWRVSKKDLLWHSRLTEADISAPLGRLPLDRMLALIERARMLTGEPGLGWYMGLQSKVSMYGYIGFGMLSAATVREAIELVIEYTPLLGTVFTLKLEERQHTKAAIVIEENTDLGASRDFVLGGLVTAMWHLGFQLSGSVPTSSAELAIPKPEYFDRLTRIGPPIRFLEPILTNCARFGPPVRFGQPLNRLLFDRAKLASRLPLADRAANRLARHQCEQHRRSLGGPLLPRGVSAPAAVGTGGVRPGRQGNS